MKFSLPYTIGISDYISKLSKENVDQIHDLFFADATINPSARHFNTVDFIDDMWDELKSIKSKYNINMHYVMNSSVWKNDVYFDESKDIIISNIHDIYRNGCTQLTINNMLLLRDPDFRASLPPIEIKLSINNKVATLDEVQFLYKYNGIQHFILDRSINRNLDEIERIYNWSKDTECTLTLLAQEGCLTKCPWKETCDNMISTFHDYDTHEVNSLRALHSARFCDTHYKHHPADLLKTPWITPPGLVIYDEMIDYIKLAGRMIDISAMSKVFDAYLNRDANIEVADIMTSHHTHDYLKGVSISDLEGHNYSNFVKNCKNRCADCDFCDRTLEQIIKNG